MAVDLGDGDGFDRFHRLGHAAAGVGVETRQALGVRERLEVGTCRECPAGSGDHHHPHLRRLGDPTGRLDDRIQHPAAERIEALGLVEGDGGDRAVDVETNAGHTMASCHHALPAATVCLLLKLTIRETMVPSPPPPARPGSSTVSPPRTRLPTIEGPVRSAAAVPSEGHARRRER